MLMKFLKIIYLTLVLLTLFAWQGMSATGCRSGDVIYAQKLGTTKFYGTNYDVYNSNGLNYLIDYNNSSQAGKVNINNVISTGSQCWINTYLNPKNNQDNAIWGTKVTYTVNPPQNLPLDDYSWLLIAGTAAIAGYYLSRKALPLT
jgi:hypothetical protein